MAPFTLHTRWMWFLFSFCLYLLSITNKAKALKTFVVSLQPDGAWSTDQWMKYKEKISGINKEFTVCHWERLSYFSVQFNGIWSYCYIKSSSDSKFQCWQLWYRPTSESAGRNVILGAQLPTTTYETGALHYRHRQWNHFCFTYSSMKKVLKLYYNGKLVKKEKQGNFTDMPTGNSVLQSMFIIGQEPDNILEGGYDPAQSYHGEISELNMWSEVLDGSQISGLADCSAQINGDIIAWEKQSFEINRAKIVELSNKYFFCEQQKKIVIFPRKDSFNGAKSLCDIHSGKLFVPTSESEEREMLNILEKYDKSCLVHSNKLQEGKAAWLGMERLNRKWYVRNDGNMLEPIGYTNWNPSQWQKDADMVCPYMQTDGMWAFTRTCTTLELCTICSFTKTPVFTLKGVCSVESQLDWNYYFITNESNQIVGYEGFVNSKLTVKNGIWSLQDDGAFADTEAPFDYPIGRKMWNYADRVCGIKSAIQKSLTLSTCYFGEEFSCNSGQCIDMSKRCNKISECADESDEEGCDLVNIPKSYNKMVSPVAFRNNGNPVNLITRVIIDSIDVIDTVKMLIGITFEIHVKWSDGRLSFENLDTKEKNVVPLEIADKLWLPPDNIIHVNAILGEIITSSIYHREVKLNNLTAAMPVNTMESIENYKYTGSETRIHITQRFKIIYRCIFKLTKFPFDQHECHFIMKLKVERKNSIAFTKDEPAVLYEGPSIFGQFEILNVTSKIKTDFKSTNFISTIKINRLYMNQMLTTFTPTLLLWLLSFSTLFIDIENFSDRFIGAVTALLVLVALLSSVQNELPKTSYFKFIDLWLLFFISNNLFIILCHIFLTYIPANQSRLEQLAIRADNTVSIVSNETTKNQTLRAKANKMGIIVLAINTFIFVIIYVFLTA